MHPRRRLHLEEAKIKKIVDEYIWKVMKISTITPASLNGAGQGIPGGLGGLAAPAPGILGGTSRSMVSESYVTKPITIKIYKHIQSGKEFSEQSMNELKQRMYKIARNLIDLPVMMLDDDPIIRDFATFIYKKG